MEAALYYADAPVYDDAAVDYADLGRPHAASAASEDGSWDDARAWQEEPPAPAFRRSPARVEGTACLGRARKRPSENALTHVLALK